MFLHDLWKSMVKCLIKSIWENKKEEEIKNKKVKHSSMEEVTTEGSLEGGWIPTAGARHRRSEYRRGQGRRTPGGEQEMCLKK